MARQITEKRFQTGKGTKVVPQINRILYATDLTKNSAYAAYFAFDLALKYGAQVVILHCTQQTGSGPYAMARPYLPREQDVADEEIQNADDEIKKRLEAIYRKAGPDITPAYAKCVSDIIVERAHAVDDILNRAQSELCDVIVLGTHGKGWLKQTFLGSTARGVLERTRIPVFIVPLPAEQMDIA